MNVHAAAQVLFARRVILYAVYRSEVPHRPRGVHWPFRDVMRLQRKKSDNDTTPTRPKRRHLLLVGSTCCTIWTTLLWQRMVWSDSSSISSSSQSLVDTKQRTVLICNMPNERLPAIIRDELRRVVALKCFDTLFRRDSLKVSEQQKLLFNLFHGNEKRNIISTVHQLCTAQEIFSEMFEERSDIVLSRQTGATEEATLQLRMLYSRREKSFLLGSNYHINTDVLSNKDYKNSTLITGRTILGQAKNTLSTVRKACSVLGGLVKEDGTPKFSGDTIEDVVNKMLDQMYELLKGKSQAEEADDDDPKKTTAEEECSEAEEEVEDPQSGDSQPSNSSERPTNWMFHGFMAVLLFGPMAAPEKRLSFFLNSDPLPQDRKNFSRAASREQKRKRDDNERSVAAITIDDSPSTSGPKRGMTVADQVRIASLELQYGRFESDRHDSRMISLKFESEMLEKKIERALQKASVTGDFEPVDRLEADLDELRRGMASCRENSHSTQTNRCKKLIGEEKKAESTVENE